MSLSNHRVAIIGTGPAGLMAADRLAQTLPGGSVVDLFEKRKSGGRKLLIAGSSGLNIANSLPVDQFAAQYRGGTPVFWQSLLRDFSVADWLRFIQTQLGLETFEGTSGRYFVREMKASRLVQKWMQRLQSLGVVFHGDHEFAGFELRSDQQIELRFTNGKLLAYDAVCFALGGGSYEPQETPLRWPPIFIEKGLAFSPFVPSNCGYQVAWSPEFIAEAEGKPLKNIVVRSPTGERAGEAMITNYGIEGTPIYTVGASGLVTLDLKPGLSETQILDRCREVKENLSPIRRVKKQLKLCEASLALLFHLTDSATRNDLEALARRIKSFPLLLGQAQPLTEAISSAGGLSFSELFDDSLMLKQFPGVFAAGEMLDWDVATGGFLIQGCVSQGYRAATGITRHLATLTRGNKE